MDRRRKLDEATVMMLRDLRAAGVCETALAAMAGIDASTVSQVVNGRTWRDVRNGIPERGAALLLGMPEMMTKREKLLVAVVERAKGQAVKQVMKRTVIRFTEQSEMQRVFMPGLAKEKMDWRESLNRTVRDQPAGTGVIVGFLHADGVENIAVHFSDGRYIHIPRNYDPPPAWIGEPLKRLGATPLYIYDIKSGGLDVLVENEWLGTEKDDSLNMRIIEYPVHSMDELRKAYRDSEVEKFLSRCRTDGLTPPSVVEVITMVERQISGTDQLNIVPQDLIDEQLRRHLAAFCDEAARRGLQLAALKDKPAAPDAARIQRQLAALKDSQITG